MSDRQRQLERRGLTKDGELTPAGERLAEKMAEPDVEPFQDPVPDRFWAPEPLNDCGLMGP